VSFSASNQQQIKMCARYKKMSVEVARTDGEKLDDWRYFMSFSASNHQQKKN